MDKIPSINSQPINNQKENDLLLELSEPIELIWFNPNRCKESSLFMKCCSVNLNLSGVTTARMSLIKYCKIGNLKPII